MIGLDDLQAARNSRLPTWNDRRPEAEARRFHQPSLGARHAPHLASESNLSEHDHIAGHRLIGVSRRESERERKVRRRLTYRETARRPYEYIALHEGTAGALVQDTQ